MTEQEIKDKASALHDELGKRYYQRHELGKRYYQGHELSKEEFDSQHGKIWADMEAKLIAEGYLIPPEPARDLVAEIDDLKARIEELERWGKI